MADRKQRILNYLATVKEASLSEIIEKCNIYYFHNTNKHAGEILGRLVNSGRVTRVSKGIFSLNKDWSPANKNNPDQIKLFEV
jgi:hypothetical protein